MPSSPPPPRLPKPRPRAVPARPAGWLLAALLALGAPAARAADPAPAPEKPAARPAPPIAVSDEINVQGRASDLLGIADSASEGVTGRQDLARRPILRAGELLETVPGVIITQHSGGGKANQYFLRGFNLDHGTDFRITLDGVPVNLPTHGHGQGYTDLNFLIPELVESVHYKKGPYYADEGDFSAAGAADIGLVDALDKGIVQVEGGSYGYRRLVLADSRKAAGGDLLGAVELYRNDGPWKRADGFRKVNGLVRYSHGDRADGFTLTAMGYDGDWDSTDQIPRRAVEAGLLDPLRRHRPLDRRRLVALQPVGRAAAGGRADAGRRPASTPCATGSTCSRTSPTSSTTPRTATSSSSSTPARPRASTSPATGRSTGAAAGSSWRWGSTAAPTTSPTASSTPASSGASRPPAGTTSGSGAPAPTPRRGCAGTAGCAPSSACAPTASTPDVASDLAGELGAGGRFAAVAQAHRPPGPVEGDRALPQFRRRLPQQRRPRRHPPR